MNERIKMCAVGAMTLFMVGAVGLLGAVDAELTRGAGDAPPPAAAARLAAEIEEDDPRFNAPAWTSLSCRVFHYCECQRCTGKHEGDPAYGVTASGATVREGRTVAVDPAIIPLGSEVLINGHVYVAEDTGVHGAAVDIYVPDHEQARQMGTYETVVMWR